MNPSATTVGSAAMVGVTIRMSVRAAGTTQCKLYFPGFFCPLEIAVCVARFRGQAAFNTLRTIQVTNTEEMC